MAHRPTYNLTTLIQWPQANEGICMFDKNQTGYPR
jgi:hypothetical protein